MTVDLSDFETAGVAPSRCPFASFPCSADQAAKLTAALAAPHIQHVAIVRVLATWGFDIGEKTVARHRKGQCRCPRT